MDNTSPNIPRKIKGGKGMMNGKETGIAFSSDYQPSNEVKKAGHQKKKLLKDILTTPLSSSPEWDKWIELTALYLQKDKAEISISDVMDYRIAQKAIQKQDVFAYQAVKDRAFGKPENKTTLANDAENPITPLQPDQVSVFLAEIRKSKG